MRREVSLSTLLLEEGVELVTCKLATAVGPEASNIDAALRLCPGCESLVSRKGLVLGAK